MINQRCKPVKNEKTDNISLPRIIKENPLEVCNLEDEYFTPVQRDLPKSRSNLVLVSDVFEITEYVEDTKNKISNASLNASYKSLLISTNSHSNPGDAMLEKETDLVLNYGSSTHITQLQIDDVEDISPLVMEMTSVKPKTRASITKELQESIAIQEAVHIPNAKIAETDAISIDELEDVSPVGFRPKIIARNDVDVQQPSQTIDENQDTISIDEIEDILQGDTMLKIKSKANVKPVSGEKIVSNLQSCLEIPLLHTQDRNSPIIEACTVKTSAFGTQQIQTEQISHETTTIEEIADIEENHRDIPAPRLPTTPLEQTIATTKLMDHSVTTNRNITATEYTQVEDFVEDFTTLNNDKNISTTINLIPTKSGKQAEPDRDNALKIADEAVPESTIEILTDIQSTLACPPEKKKPTLDQENKSKIRGKSYKAAKLERGDSIIQAEKIQQRSPNGRSSIGKMSLQRMMGDRTAGSLISIQYRKVKLEIHHPHETNLQGNSYKKDLLKAVLAIGSYFLYYLEKI
ncbi:hypothetical protein HDV06_002181 [Boothiomyces sp. JEL0866]|nr:hypothetical protein HDV06_002181 [Boothiomyces sp. JEL0866]